MFSKCAAVALGLVFVATAAGRLSIASTSTDEAIRALRAGDEARAVATLNGAIARGDAAAANLLGEMIARDAKSPAEHGRACDLFEMAAAAGLPAAQHNLATCYNTGLGRTLDYHRSLAWYGRAADQGHLRSLCPLGKHFLYGQGVTRDAAKAIELCRRGAEAGDRDAQADLGQIYLAGHGGEPNYGEAVKWLSLAASGGQPAAAFHLGRMHAAGLGMPKDLHVAAYWFRAAAKHGAMEAVFPAARVYFAMAMGDGGEVKEIYAPQALAWLALAEEFDPDPAKRAAAARMRETLAESVPHLEEDAEGRVALWRARITEQSQRS